MNIINEKLIKKGDIIQFGTFPQSQSDETEFHSIGNSVYLDNKEKRVYKCICENFSSKEDKYFNFDPILWEVIEVNANYYRLLSLKMLMYSSLSESEKNNCTYSTSDLRKYLNDNFYNLAFSKDEKAIILSTSIADENSTPQFKQPSSTVNCDKVFLPSIIDLDKIGDFHLIKEKTTYAENTALFGNLNSWLTRTPGSPEYYSFGPSNTVKMIAQSWSGNGCKMKQAAIHEITGVAPEIIIQIPTYLIMNDVVIAGDKKRLLKELIKKQKWKQDGKCQYCGGVLKGLFLKKCTICGKLKDY